MTICSLMFGQTVKNFAIETDVKDYNFHASGVFTHISSSHKNVSYLSDEKQPELPYLTIRLLLPKNTCVTSVDITNTGKEYIGNFTLPSNTLPTTISNLNNGSDISISAKYDKNKTYPLSNKASYSQGSIDGYQVLYVSLCPFEYYAKTGDLYFKKGLSLNCTLNPKNTSLSGKNGRVMRAIVSNIVDNSYEMEALYENFIIGTGIQVNYLVITNNALKSSFEPLLKSKISHGMIPYITTTEEIMQRYSHLNADSLYKIKACIQDYYMNRGVGYVLLGGDCNIIPVRYCHCEDTSLSKVNSYDVPTDLYYACVDNDNLSWDSNNNGIHGEFSDTGIDIQPDVFISRLPASNADEVSNYINKRLLYETDQLYESDSYNKILFAGALLGATIEGIRDVVYWGNENSNTIHQLCPNAEITCLYDTCSNLGDTLYEAASLQRQFNKEFAIVNVDTHGGTDNWFTKADIHSDLNPNEYYTTDSIDNVRSKGNTVMITSACFTNDFTDTESLGRNFLLSESNGTLLYNGGTREGFLKFKKLYDPNDPYDNTGPIKIDQNILQRFYAGEHNMGVCIYQARLSTLSPNDIVDRWNLYSNNTIGDPDIMLYVEKPNTFYIDAIYSSDYVILSSSGVVCNAYSQSGENECINEYPIEEDEEYGSLFVDPFNIIFGAYRDGYIPFDSRRDFCNNLLIQDSYDFDLSLKGKTITIGSDIADNEDISHGNVVVSNGHALNLEVGHELTITNNFTVEVGGTLNITPAQ